MTNYLVGKTEILGDFFKNTYSNSTIISASTEKEAIEKYKALIEPRPSPILTKCIGVVDDNNTLIISNYTLNYNSAKNLPLALGEQKNYLVSRLLNAPNNLSPYAFYIPQYITATSDKEAINIYASRHCSDSFPIHCFGYLDDQNRFIIPNINDYLK